MNFSRLLILSLTFTSCSLSGSITTSTKKTDATASTSSALSQAGLVCDGKADDTVMLKMLLGGPDPVILPKGLCVSTTSIAVTAPSVTGEGIQKSLIQFPKETDGLVLRAGSSLSNFSIVGAGRCQATGPVWNQDGSCKLSRSGLIFGTVGQIENLEVYGWSGNGITLNCDISSRGTNCNGSILRHPTVHRCSGDGILLTGSDANGVFIEQPVIKTNDGWGINSDAFIGPTNVIGGLLSTNKLGALRARGAATFIGTYIENATSNTHDKVLLLSPRAYLIGGNVDVDNATGNVIANGLMLGLWSTYNPLGIKVWNDFGAPAGTINTVQQLRNSSDNSTFALRWNPDTAQYEWNHANATNRTAIGMTAAAGLKNNSGVVIIPPGRAVFRDGFYMGSTTFAREFSNSAGKPTTPCSATTSGALMRNIIAKVGEFSTYQCAQDSTNIWAWHGAGTLQ